MPEDQEVIEIADESLVFEAKAGHEGDLENVLGTTREVVVNPEDSEPGELPQKKQ